MAAVRIINLTLLFCAVAVVKSQVILNGVCPNVTLEQDFDAEEVSAEINLSVVVPAYNNSNFNIIFR